MIARTALPHLLSPPPPNRQSFRLQSVTAVDDSTVLEQPIASAASPQTWRRLLPMNRAHYQLSAAMNTSFGSAGNPAEAEAANHPAVAAAPEADDNDAGTECDLHYDDFYELPAHPCAFDQTTPLLADDRLAAAFAYGCAISPLPGCDDLRNCSLSPVGRSAEDEAPSDGGEVASAAADAADEDAEETAAAPEGSISMDEFHARLGMPADTDNGDEDKKSPSSNGGSPLALQKRLETIVEGVFLHTPPRKMRPAAQRFGSGGAVARLQAHIVADYVRNCRRAYRLQWRPEERACAAATESVMASVRGVSVEEWRTEQEAQRSRLVPNHSAALGRGEAPISGGRVGSNSNTGYLGTIQLVPAGSRPTVPCHSAALGRVPSDADESPPQNGRLRRSQWLPYDTQVSAMAHRRIYGSESISPRRRFGKVRSDQSSPADPLSLGVIPLHSTASGQHPVCHSAALTRDTVALRADGGQQESEQKVVVDRLQAATGSENTDPNDGKGLRLAEVAGVDGEVCNNVNTDEQRLSANFMVAPARLELAARTWGYRRTSQPDPDISSIKRALDMLMMAHEN